MCGQSRVGLSLFDHLKSVFLSITMLILHNNIVRRRHMKLMICSASKFFEKLILKQIQYLENKNELDLTGKQQHGFKRKKSTATVGTLIQSKKNNQTLKKISSFFVPTWILNKYICVMRLTSYGSNCHPSPSLLWFAPQKK